MEFIYIGSTVCICLNIWVSFRDRGNLVVRNQLLFVSQGLDEFFYLIINLLATPQISCSMFGGSIVLTIELFLHMCIFYLWRTLSLGGAFSDLHVRRVARRLLQRMSVWQTQVGVSTIFLYILSFGERESHATPKVDITRSQLVFRVSSTIVLC